MKTPPKRRLHFLGEMHGSTVIRFIRNSSWRAAMLLLVVMVCAAKAQTYSVVHDFGDPQNLPAQPAAPLIQGPDGVLYGTTTRSGSQGYPDGTLFKLRPDGSEFAVLKCFRAEMDRNYASGATPSGGLLLAGTELFGMTEFGGNSNRGTVFRLNTDGTGFTVLKHFAGPDGSSPSGELLLSGATLYGMTSLGGDSQRGTVFRLNLDGSGFTVLKRFASADGVHPVGSLVLSDGMLCGATTGGGISNYGTLFRLAADGSAFSVIRHFTNIDVGKPMSGLLASGGTLYGIAGGGGGKTFRLNSDGTDFAVLKSFSGNEGRPVRLFLSGSILYGTTASGGLLYRGTVFKMGTNGSGFATLHEFTDIGEARFPAGGVLLSGDMLYGTAEWSGGYGGTVFRLNADGTGFGIVKRFGGDGDGREPGSLVLSGATLYGTTSAGGTNDLGTVFRVDTDGSDYALLKQFSWVEGDPNEIFRWNDGWSPGSLIVSGARLYGSTLRGGFIANTPFEVSRDWGTIFLLDTNGNNLGPGWFFGASHQFEGRHPVGGLVLQDTTLYGVTREGGNFGHGAIFKFNTSDGSDLGLLKHFEGSDGDWPAAGLVLFGTTLFGTTAAGGSADCGTVFKIDTNGSGFTVLKHFAGDDGRWPQVDLVLSGTTLYGTTAYGGGSDCGVVFKLGTDGSGFTVIKHFNGSEGMNPATPLVVSGATLYGATERGGAFAGGTVFQINTDGTGYLVLKHFSGLEGSKPAGPLVLRDRTLYGTAALGGGSSAGVVFRLMLEPRIVNPAWVGNNLTFRFPTEPGLNYAVEFNDDLNATSWEFHHAQTGDGSLMLFQVPMSSDAQGYFRVRQL